MQELFELFDEIGLPYYRQGSLSDADYQPSFFTFWNIDTPNDSFYDNAEHRYIEYVQVCFYTNDANKIYSQLDAGENGKSDGEFYQKAKAKGFVFQGKAHDTNADKDNYYGRFVLIKIIHKMED
ncbi:MAG: hypothetical protein ACI4MS_02705 [Candidatus Coproplasma sp.]